MVRENTGQAEHSWTWEIGIATSLLDYHNRGHQSYQDQQTLSYQSSCVFSNIPAENCIKKKSLHKQSIFIEELFTKSNKFLNVDTYLMYKQMTPPDISPPQHKAWISDKKRGFLAVDPKASSDIRKVDARPSAKASFAQSHKRFKAGGKSGPMSNTYSGTNLARSFTFFHFFCPFFLLPWNMTLKNNCEWKLPNIVGLLK